MYKCMCYVPAHISYRLVTVRNDTRDIQMVDIFDMRRVEGNRYSSDPIRGGELPPGEIMQANIEERLGDRALGSRVSVAVRLNDGRYKVMLSENVGEEVLVTTILRNGSIMTEEEVWR